MNRPNHPLRFGYLPQVTGTGVGGWQSSSTRLVQPPPRRLNSLPQIHAGEGSINLPLVLSINCTATVSRFSNLRQLHGKIYLTITISKNCTNYPTAAAAFHLSSGMSKETMQMNEWKYQAIQRASRYEASFEYQSMAGGVSLRNHTDIYAEHDCRNLTTNYKIA